jgi:hypothetical protein
MSIDHDTFQAPPARLRGAPFLSLNHDLRDHQRLRDLIDDLRSMGLGGAHLHVRSGLRTPYLGEDFLAAIRAMREHAAAQGMFSYLYDEDTWPSGFAGGAVTRERSLRQHWLQLAQTPPEPTPDRRLLAAYRIQLDDRGCLQQAQRLPPDAPEADWYLWQERAGDSDRFNGQAYLDVLNPAAVDAFIRSTHEVYRQAFGGAFPADVPAIFTDEPQWAWIWPLQGPCRGAWRAPWTPELLQADDWGCDPLDIIPLVVWPQADGPSPWRWRFWRSLSERFANAFSDRLGAWCQQHGIALTGHLMAEATLASQMGAVGECMRHYRGFQIPGIDLLQDSYQPTTAKQAVSVARQEGRHQVLSELYGVTDWNFPFRGHKCQGDWQAALGITLRVHHLTWLSMAGDSKRDYPAAIGPQSPWFREYPLIEDHFARVNAALEGGEPLVRLAVVHPIESFWLRRGIRATEGDAATEAEDRFRQITDWLLQAQLDFDYISESLLPEQWRPREDGRLQVGAMCYDAVLLPDLLSLRRSSLQALQQCVSERVLICGRTPQRLDGLPAPELEAALAAMPRIPWSQAAIVAACEPWRELRVQGGDSSRILYQLRQHADGERVLFCCNRQLEAQARPPGRGAEQPVQLHLRGRWRVEEWDTLSGERQACPQWQEQDETIVPWRLQPHAHRLLRLIPDAAAPALPLPAGDWEVIGDCPEPTRLHRAEPNVLLLDRAAWRLDDGDWQLSEDPLHIARMLRERLAWPFWQQPYSIQDPGAEHRLQLRFSFHSRIPLRGIVLVCERAEEATIRIDDRPIANTASGWWVDRDLPTLPLPDLEAGRHELLITLPMDARRRHVEWCYLLGEFGVRLRGAQAELVAWDEQPGWGDLCGQGLPYYGGNVVYDSSFVIHEPGRYAIRCPHFGAPLLRLRCDDRDLGPCAFAPYRVELGELQAGEHRLAITAFGHRRNSFGALHNCAPDWRWWGPAAWLTTGADANPVPQLRATGLLRPPLLERHREQAVAPADSVALA